MDDLQGLTAEDRRGNIIKPKGLTSASRHAQRQNTQRRKLHCILTERGYQYAGLFLSCSHSYNMEVITSCYCVI